MSDSTNDGGDKKGWLGRLTGGLKRTSSSLGAAIADLVTKGPMDPAKLDMIQDALVRADLGYDLAHRVTTVISQGVYSQGITPDEVKAVVAAEVAKILQPVAKPLLIGDARPFVILVAGVNGSGKTTTIGKLARSFRPKGHQWCSPPVTPSALPPSISSKSGASAPAPEWWRTRRAPIPQALPSRR
jgi:fused signal recognition particle receptor